MNYLSINNEISDMKLGWNPVGRDNVIDVSASIYQYVGNKPQHVYYKDDGAFCNHNTECKSEKCGMVMGENDLHCCAVTDENNYCLDRAQGETCAMGVDR